MEKTQKNLKDAFTGESKANRKYLAYAKLAEAENKKGLAKLFRAVSEGETAHAMNEFKALGEIKGSAESLKDAIAGETYESTEMYPKFIEDAKAEGQEQAAIIFTGAKEVEKVHKKLFEEALAKVEQGEDIPEKEYYICSICGYLQGIIAPEKCPVCGFTHEYFTRM